MDLVKRLLVPLVVLAFVVAAVVSVFGGDTGRTVVAHFPRAISVYEGSDVRVLGEESNGWEVERRLSENGDPTLVIDASVGAGSVRVERAVR